jgi:hypothetical protein
MEDAGLLGIEAWKAVEGFVKRKSTQNNGFTCGDGSEDVYEDLPDAGAEKPSEDEIQTAWDAVASTAHFVLEARNGSNRKPHRRALQAVLSTPPPNPDILCFHLAATIARAKTTIPRTGVIETTEWETLLQLLPDSTPYANSYDLATHIQSYLHLLALLPPHLLPYATPETLLALAERDSHNSFGVRSLDDHGDEFLGYGVWPVASFFNHSCSPNVGKRRVGRAWEFWTNRPVLVGEELCISYMGGDEVDLDVLERRERLRETWVFECRCLRCGREEGGEGEGEGLDKAEKGLDGLGIGKDSEI